MSDSLFRPPWDCPRGSRGELPAHRPLNGRAAPDSTIPS